MAIFIENTLNNPRKSMFRNKTLGEKFCDLLHKLIYMIVGIIVLFLLTTLGVWFILDLSEQNQTSIATNNQDPEN